MKFNYVSQKVSAKDLPEELKKISGNVCGFYRLSNAEEPVMLHGESMPDISDRVVPFLFEAAFFNGMVSVGIRQYNDFWLVNRVEWNETPPRSPQSGDDYLVYQQFAKTREELLFYTQYLPVEKNGFEILAPAWNAFIGFKNEKEN